MPGTIQVSVLEFKGLPSTSPSIILKVALGKKEYQTSDVGDFSFPLTTLRDHLVLTVQDAEGNEITRKVIQTLSIVEKVSWNDIFDLDGGGHVHLQLQFILSDAERNRIRSMREAAMKKKQGSIPNVIPGQSEITSSKSDSIPQAKQKLSASSQESSSKSEYWGSEVAAKSTSVSPEDDHVDESVQQGPLEKTPSNVRKLVGAFESSLVQDLKSPVKLSAIKPEEKKVGKGGYLKGSDTKDLPEAAERISGRHKNPFVAGDLKVTGKGGEKIDFGRSTVGNIISQATTRLKQSTSAAIESRRKDSSSSGWANLSVDLERPSLDESASISGRAYSFGLSAEQQDSGGTSYVEGRRKNGSAEISVQVASSEKPKSLECREEELFHFEKSGMWIFPNDRKRLCITTAGKRVMNLLGSRNTEARSHQKKKSSSVSGHVDKISAQHGNEHEKKKHHNKTQNLRKSRSESSSGDASGGGLVQQAIKVAIIVGFGVLVFLTRQREPRKSNKDANDLLSGTSEYIDEHILEE